MLHGLAAICHEAGNGGYIGSHCPKQCAPPLYSAVNSLWHPSRTNRNEKTLPTRNDEEPVKKLRGTTDIWEMSVTRNYRITFQWKGQSVLLRNIGSHAILKKP